MSCKKLRDDQENLNSDCIFDDVKELLSLYDNIMVAFFKVLIFIFIY